MLFVVCWIIGAIVSWIGVTVYTKNRTVWSWKGYFQYAKAQMESPIKEATKWILFIVAWPIEILAVVYNIIYARYLTRSIVKNFHILDKES